MPQPGTRERAPSPRRAILVRSLVTALVVGTALNVVNQGEYLLAGEGLMWGRCLLNYLVPFCVAAFSAWQTQRQCRPDRTPDRPD